MPAIHQVVAGFSRGDAISNEALVLQRMFRAWGCGGDLFCEQRRIPPELRRQALDAESLAGRVARDDVVLLHLSIGSPVNDLFARLACRKALLYHNITPADTVAAVHPQLAHMLALGREQMQRLRGVAEVVLADSAFNAAELMALGYGPVGVLPLVLDFDSLDSIHHGRLKAYRDGCLNVLFVGRCVCNKRLEDLLSCFYYLQRYVEPQSRLIHVGSHNGTEKYHALLVSRARDLRLRNVVLTGTLPQRELNACYRSADVFLSMSEHEGFCIPLIESMVHDVPVLAYAAAAVPETLGGAGVLFHDKQFDMVAEMAVKLARPGPLRSAVLSGQRERLARYRARNLEQELRALLAPLLS